MKTDKLDVMYEDNHLIVVNKPAMIPSQSDKSGDEDMLSMVKAYVKKKYGKPGEVYIGLVHRLDRPTEGIMVFARTSKAAKRLSEQIKNGSMEKYYYALVWDEEQKLSPTGFMEDYLIKDRDTNTVRVTDRTEHDAKGAILEYWIEERMDAMALVRIRLITGRSHQIRVQFSSRGCPLVGDMKYGRGESGGLALMACRVEFDHPTRKERMTFELPLDSFRSKWIDERLL